MPATREDSLKVLSQRIKKAATESNKKVIPIISNAVRNNRIFDIDFNYNIGLANLESPNTYIEGLNIDEELAEQWADDIEYPLLDKHQLARVAVYNYIFSLDEEEAKRKYFNFLKRYLLEIAKSDPNVSCLVDDLKDQLENFTFSEIASELGYPRYKNDKNRCQYEGASLLEHGDELEDPLNLLAKLPFPIYITTSPHDFMERALDQVGKSVRTQVCFWRGNISDALPEHRPDRTLSPTVTEPVVYHLFGFEKYPESLLISEDDYLNFLVKVSQPLDTQDPQPILPIYIREALSLSSLILLGYRLHDWDFRVLFRGIITNSTTAKPYQQSKRSLSVAIQLDPIEQKEIIRKEEAQKYLREYFDLSNFEVEWGVTEVFVKKLWDAYQGKEI